MKFSKFLTSLSYYLGLFVPSGLTLYLIKQSLPPLTQLSLDETKPVIKEEEIKPEKEITEEDPEGEPEEEEDDNEDDESEEEEEEGFDFPPPPPPPPEPPAPEPEPKKEDKEEAPPEEEDDDIVILLDIDTVTTPIKLKEVEEWTNTIFDEDQENNPQ